MDAFGLKIGIKIHCIANDPVFESKVLLLNNFLVVHERGLRLFLEN